MVPDQVCDSHIGKHNRIKLWVSNSSSRNKETTVGTAVDGRERRCGKSSGLHVSSGGRKVIPADRALDTDSSFMPCFAVFTTTSNTSDGNPERSQWNQPVGQRNEAYTPRRLRMKTANIGSKWGIRGLQKPP